MSYQQIPHDKPDNWGFPKCKPIFCNLAKIKNYFIFKYFIFELNTPWAQSDAFGVKGRFSAKLGKLGIDVLLNLFGAF